MHVSGRTSESGGAHSETRGDSQNMAAPVCTCSGREQDSDVFCMQIAYTHQRALERSNRSGSMYMWMAAKWHADMGIVVRDPLAPAATEDPPDTVSIHVITEVPWPEEQQPRIGDQLRVVVPTRYPSTHTTLSIDGGRPHLQIDQPVVLARADGANSYRVTESGRVDLPPTHATSVVHRRSNSARSSGVDVGDLTLLK